MENHYYSVHDLIRISSNVKLHAIPSYFEQKERFENPDVEISEGKLRFCKTKKGGLLRSNYRYWTEGSKLCIDYGAGARLMCDDLLGNARIRFTKNFRRFSSKGFLDELILRILPIKLIQKGYALIHSGCVSYDGRGILITGTPDSGKTSTVLSLLGERFRFMADDYTILREEGMVYSYPKEVKISPYTLTGQIFHPKRKPRSRLLIILLEKFLKWESTELKKIPTEFIEDRVKADRFFLLGGYSEHEEAKRPTKGRMMGELLFPVLVPPNFPYTYGDLYLGLVRVNLWSYLEKGRKVLERGMKGTKCYELRAPSIKSYPRMIEEML